MLARFVSWFARLAEAFTTDLPLLCDGATCDCCAHTATA
jgi:hypothetical protein